MSAFHVVVRPAPADGDSNALTGLFDVVVDGVNVTARIGEAQQLALLGELGQAVAALLSGKRPRATLQLYAEDEAWELGLEADGAAALLSVYRAGAQPEVAVHARRVALAALRHGIVRALDEAVAGRPPLPTRAALSAARVAVEQAPEGVLLPVERTSARVTPKVPGLVLQAEAAFRQDGRRPRDERGRIERADLHSLLLEGTIELGTPVRSVRLPGVQLFLFAEQLLALAEEVLEAWQGGRATFRRVELGGDRLAVRRGAGDGPVALTVSSARPGRERAPLTFPEIPTQRFLQLAVRFALNLAETYVAHDPGQRKNLRLTAFVDVAKRLDVELEHAFADDGRTNPEPDSYRSYATPKRRPNSDGQLGRAGRLRFFPRWSTTVAELDLRAVMLTSEQLLIGAAQETLALSPSTGEVAWRIPTRRAACVLTPAGLARIHPDGRVTLIDIGSGETRFALPLAPRPGGGASGAVVNAPGLPKLLVLVEGDRSVTAIDLVSGDIRYRHTLPRAGSYRVRRAGKLLLISAKDTALTALDVTSGELVWRLRARHPFAGDVAVDGDDAFALGGGPGTPARLHKLDPWTGELGWSVELPERATTLPVPLISGGAVAVPVASKAGAGLRAYSRTDGTPLFAHPPGLSTGAVSWLPLEDAFVMNSAAGTLSCIDAATGELRYSHVFSRGVEADTPRRLEPVMEAGALFVPQEQVHVLRPSDGELLGSLPTELIPDVLRVDDKCNVIVCEESGHVAAYGAAARLSLVK